MSYRVLPDKPLELPAAELAAERGYAVRLCDPHVKPQTPGLPAPQTHAQKRG